MKFNKNYIKARTLIFYTAVIYFLYSSIKHYFIVLYILQIYSLIDEKIEREDGPKVLEYILVGLSVKPDSQKTVENVCIVVYISYFNLLGIIS